jgi:hypothetical protein
MRIENEAIKGRYPVSLTGLRRKNSCKNRDILNTPSRRVQEGKGAEAMLEADKDILFKLES